MKNLFVLLLSMFTFSAFAQVSDKEKAKDFGLSIIQKFYDGKCTDVYDYLSDVVIAFEGGMQVKKIMFNAEDLCEARIFNSADNNNFTNYLANYSPEIMNHTEFANRFPNFYIKLEPGDFYFNGCNRTGKKELFASGDMVRFIFRKTAEGNFTIISN